MLQLASSDFIRFREFPREADSEIRQSSVQNIEEQEENVV